MTDTTMEILMRDAALNEARELLRDLDEFLSDDPHPMDGGSWNVLDLRQRIKAFLTDEPRAAV